jgi:hypothetical protein
VLLAGVAVGAGVLLHSTANASQQQAQTVARTNPLAPSSGAPSPSSARPSATEATAHTTAASVPPTLVIAPPTIPSAKPATSTKASTVRSSTPAAKASPSPQTSALVSYASSKCLSVTGNKAVTGSTLEIWRCINANGQRWVFDQNSTLRTFNLCMSVSGTLGNGTPVYLAQCSGGKNQMFHLNSAHELINSQSSECVDVKSNGTANGTLLQLWKCGGTGNQRWYLV